MTTRTDRNQTFDQDGNLVAEEVVEVDTTAEVNEGTLRQQADVAIAELRPIATGSGNMTTAQLTVAFRQFAKAAVVILRLLLRKFDAVD